MEFSHALKTMGDISKLNLDLYVKHKHNAGKINLYDLCDSALQYFPYNRINFNKTIEHPQRRLSTNVQSFDCEHSVQLSSKVFLVLSLGVIT